MQYIERPGASLDAFIRPPCLVVTHDHPARKGSSCRLQKVASTKRRPYFPGSPTSRWETLSKVLTVHSTRSSPGSGMRHRTARRTMRLTVAVLPLSRRQCL